MPSLSHAVVCFTQPLTVCADWSLSGRESWSAGCRDSLLWWIFILLFSSLCVTPVTSPCNSCATACNSCVWPLRPLHAYYIRILYKACAFLLIRTLHVRSFAVRSREPPCLWLFSWVAPCSLALEVFNSLIQTLQLASRAGSRIQWNPSTITTTRSDYITMQLLIDQLDVNSCVGEIDEYLERFSFWQDAHEGMSEIAAKGAFLTVIGQPRSSLLTRLHSCVSQDPAGGQSSRDQGRASPSLQTRELRGAWASKVQRPSDSIHNFVLQLQIHAARCSFGAELDNHLRNRLIAGINDAALQKKMLREKRPTFSSLRMLCEK